MADEDTLAAAPGETTTVDETVNLEAPEATEAKQGTTEARTDDTGSDDAGDDGKPRKPSGAQRAKIREARLLSELQEREREIEDLRRSQPAAKTASENEPKPPREEDFNGDFFAYQAAQTAYAAGQATREAIRQDREARERTERQTKQAELVRERQIAHAERVEDAREVIADFDAVMATMKGVNVRNELIDEIMSSDKSALISYHLAQNPSELNALNSMSERELARAVGRLEATVKMPSAKKQTTAPAPLTQLKGGASGSFDPVSASMDEYVAKRKAGWKG